MNVKVLKQQTYSLHIFKKSTPPINLHAFPIIGYAGGPGMESYGLAFAYSTVWYDVSESAVAVAAEALTE